MAKRRQTKANKMPFLQVTAHVASVAQAQNLPPESRTPEQAAKTDLINKLAEEIRVKNPDVNKHITAARKDNGLNTADVAKITAKANGPTGLMGLVQNKDLRPENLMDVWKEATPAERKQIQWVVRNRIATTSTISDEDKRTYIAQIQKDVRGTQ